MEAKDTVMSGDQQGYYWNENRYGIQCDTQGLLKAQAEISFKAGMKEVVEWITQENERDLFEGDAKVALWVRRKQWQVKKKEWGINVS